MAIGQRERNSIIKEEYEQGTRLRDLSLKYGLQSSYLAKMLKRLGVTLRPKFRTGLCKNHPDRQALEHRNVCKECYNTYSREWASNRKNKNYFHKKTVKEIPILTEAEQRLKEKYKSIDWDYVFLTEGRMGQHGRLDIYITARPKRYSDHYSQAIWG